MGLTVDLTLLLVAMLCAVKREMVATYMGK